MRLIGLTGNKGCGKDTVAEIILNHTASASRRAYADNLKSEVAELLGITIKDINKDKSRFRLMLQFWGTEWRRGQDKEYWLKMMAKELNNLRNHYPKEHLVVVTDVRFPNEAEQIRSFGGIIVRVDRPDNPFDTRDQHCSENLMREYPVSWTIKNTSGLTNLHIEVMHLLDLGI